MSILCYQNAQINTEIMKNTDHFAFIHIVYFLVPSHVTPKSPYSTTISNLLLRSHSTFPGTYHPFASS